MFRSPPRVRIVVKDSVAAFSKQSFGLNVHSKLSVYETLTGSNIARQSYCKVGISYTKIY